jgi:hypothetical protein
MAADELATVDTMKRILAQKDSYWKIVEPR